VAFDVAVPAVLAGHVLSWRTSTQMLQMAGNAQPKPYGVQRRCGRIGQLQGNDLDDGGSASGAVNGRGAKNL
jgi:hypothetical protein